MMLILQRTQTPRALPGFKFLPVIVSKLANDEVQQQFDMQNDLLHPDFVVAALLSPSILVVTSGSLKTHHQLYYIPLRIFPVLMCGVTGISPEDKLFVVFLNCDPQLH